ncbi:MAG: hypothetical protein Q7U82_00205 [Gammaproteobacteria bacterium]|nr:hypothetical protein [Gammaproteobacteria bacterium]
MSDLQLYFRNIAMTPALTAGNSPGYSEHLYLIDQFDEVPTEGAAGSDVGEIILWGDVFVEARDPQRLAQNH